MHGYCIPVFLEQFSIAITFIKRFAFILCLLLSILYSILFFYFENSLHFTHTEMVMQSSVCFLKRQEDGLILKEYPINVWNPDLPTMLRLTGVFRLF